jgi:hypothetical protein
MAGGGFIAAAASPVSPVGVATASGTWAVGVEGAASERHRPKYREESTNVRTNAPTASPHNMSIRLSMSTPMKKR